MTNVIILVIYWICLATANAFSVVNNVSNISNPGLISLVIHYFKSHENGTSFRDILYSLALNQPVLFNNIIQKVLQDDQVNQYKFISYFIFGNRDIFDAYVDVENMFMLHIPFTKMDLWCLSQIVLKPNTFNMNIIIHNVSFIAGIDKFRVLTKAKDNRLEIVCVRNCLINWSEIPRYLTHLSVRHAHPSIVDLSSIDQMSNINTLQINVWNGTIIFPDYSLPHNLTTLILRNHYNNIDCRQLFKIATNVQYLTIESNGLVKNDFIGIENMINLKQLTLTCSSHEMMEYYAYIIGLRLENAYIVIINNNIYINLQSANETGINATVNRWRNQSNHRIVHIGNDDTTSTRDFLLLLISIVSMFVVMTYIFVADHGIH
eukprot:428936_1